MRLFKDRSLNIAMLVSMSWHLICIFLVAPILISGHIRDNSATVSFLGSILERVAPVPDKPFSLDKLYLMQKIERMSIHSGEFTLPSPEPIPKVFSAKPDKAKVIFSGDRYKQESFKMHYKKKQPLRIKFKNVLVSGEARNRELLYKPDLSNISIFPSCFSSDYNVDLRFKVSRDGFIESPECIVSSGSPEIDQMAVRYIRRWQFVPQDEGLKETQEGIVRVDFSSY